MARTALTKTVAPGSYPTTGTTLTWNNGDSSNNNDFTFNGNELILLRNAHGSVTKTCTVVGVADSTGRTASLTISLAAGATRVIGPMNKTEGWQQSGQKFYLNPEDSNVKIAVISLPGY